jgi:hypothetical protein
MRFVEEAAIQRSGRVANPSYKPAVRVGGVSTRPVGGWITSLHGTTHKESLKTAL